MRQKVKEYIIWSALTLYAGYSFCYLFNLIFQNGNFSFSFFSIIVYAILAVCIKKFMDDIRLAENGSIKKRRIGYSFFFSFLFSLSLILGWHIRNFGMTPPGYAAKGFILFMAAGVAMGFIMPVNLWFGYLDKRDMKKERQRIIRTKELLHKRFWIQFCIIMICWIPVALAFYPAIMSHDFHRQAGEAYNGWVWFVDHHPLLHTTMIRVAFLIGEKLGNLQMGMALYSIFQMTVLALVFSYACCMIGRLTGKKWTMNLGTLFFAVVPFQPIMALSVTKDSIFSAVFLLFLLLILEKGWKHGKKQGILLDIAFVITGILVILLRNNAIYALMGFVFFYLFFAGNKKIEILFLCACIFIGGVFAKNLMLNVMQARKGSKVEMYSLFIEQMGRVAYDHKDSDLTEEDAALINQYVPWEFWEEYNPILADSLKGLVTFYTFDHWKEDVPKMLFDWAKIGLRYPNEYVDAFLALTGGYWFIDDLSHAEIYGYGEESGFGLINAFNGTPSELVEQGLTEHSFLPAVKEIYLKIVNGNCYYRWPVLSNLFKPAFYCWILAACMISFAYQRKHARQVLNILPLFYLLTMYLGPCVLFRYVYPVIVCIPLLIAWLLSDCEWQGEKNPGKGKWGGRNIFGKRNLESEEKNEK